MNEKVVPVGGDRHQAPDENPLGGARGVSSAYQYAK